MSVIRAINKLKLFFFFSVIQLLVLFRKSKTEINANSTSTICVFIVNATLGASLVPNIFCMLIYSLIIWAFLSFCENFNSQFIYAAADAVLEFFVSSDGHHLRAAYLSLWMKVFGNFCLDSANICLLFAFCGRLCACVRFLKR